MAKARATVGTNGSASGEVSQLAKTPEVTRTRTQLAARASSGKGRGIVAGAGA